MRKLLELARYYAVGGANTAFGYGVYALFVFLGTGAYVAQLLGQVIGVVFNYFTYRRLVFHTTAHPYKRFIGAYVFQYAISLGLLAAFLQVISSEYWAGLATLALASLINYFVLKRWVFGYQVGAR
ncbi:MAG: GtrA family protein [Gammaproteobacteria bacterium]